VVVDKAVKTIGTMNTKKSSDQTVSTQKF